MTYQTLIAAVGLAIFLEGLVFALAPSRLEDILRLIADMPVPQRRTLGLIAMAIGLGLCWLAVG